jgi:hypothetical protein
MLGALNDHKEEVLKEIERTKAKAETLRRDLDDLWADAHACEYDLVSVFMHRGKFASSVDRPATNTQAKRVEQDTTGHTRLIYRITVSSLPAATQSVLVSGAGLMVSRAVLQIQ